MLVIVTNISKNNDGEPVDHQSMIVECESWESYIDMYKNNKHKSLHSTMGWVEFKKDWIMSNLKYDDYHMSYDIENGNSCFSVLVYKVREEFSLKLDLSVE